MDRTLIAALAVAAALGWGLGDAGAQQAGDSPSADAPAGATAAASPEAGGQPSEASAAPSPAGASGQQSGTAGTDVTTSERQPSSGTARAGEATADPAKIETYVQMRKYLQSQVISTTPADLSPQRDAIEKHLKAAHRQWMGADEFIEFHRQVQSDPALKAMVEARMQQGAGTSGAAGAPSGEASGAMPAPGATEGAAPSEAQPGASPQ